jgi:K+ transporter
VLINALLTLNFILIALHLYFYSSQKQKNYGLSIFIRLLTLGLFSFVILDRYETQSHLILVLVSWAIFEIIEGLFKKKKASAP